ncbi:hypothetical protein DXG01_015014 [Tephrocybe rancida]|nr:hypothetical protein DXG01_015014 [Tephrocybe rancida]
MQSLLQPYSYEFASSSHGILKEASLSGKPMSHKTGSLETPSELTPLIPGGSGKGAKEYLEERSPNHSSTHRRNSTSKSVAIGKGLGHKEGAVYSVFGSSDVSLRLQNTGTVARDHLALERTFLAYIMSIAEFYSGETHPSKYKRQVEAWARPLGASAVIIAIFVLCIGTDKHM